jgi:hypothetical protein
MTGSIAARNDEGDHRIKADDPAAIRLLKDEHHAFRILFDRAGNADGAALVIIAQELCLRLAVHMTIEEELLYPAVRAVLGDDEVNEGIVEHESGKRLVAEIEQLDGSEALYKAKIHVLGEETLHHIDEEDAEMFVEAAEAHRAGKLDLDTLGEQMRARQAALYDQVAKVGELGPTDEAIAEEIGRV